MRLELKGVTKRFPGVVANDAVDLVIEPSEIHALLGENGAGKTTLMNVLYGLYHADEGEILIDGAPVKFHDPGDAIRAGLGMVHQHFMLIPVFTVTENIILGVEPTKRLGWLDRRAAKRRVEEISERYGLEVPADAVVEELAVGVQQRVEILKALYRQAETLILDEPTAVLTPQEDRGAVHRHAFAEGCREVGHLHHPQAEGSPRGLRSHNGPSRRQGRRHHLTGGSR